MTEFEERLAFRVIAVNKVHSVLSRTVARLSPGIVGPAK